MADNITVGGVVYATDDIGSVHYQRVKIGLGVDGSAADWRLGQQLPADSAPVVTPAPVQTSVTPGITAGAYQSGDVVGGAQTHSPAGLPSGGTASIVHVVIKDKAAQAHNYEVWVFDRALGTSPGADGATFTLADTDVDKFKTVIIPTQSVSAVNNSFSEWEGSRPVRSNATSYEIYLVTRGTPTFASTTDVIVEIEWSVGQ